MNIEANEILKLDSTEVEGADSEQVKEDESGVEESGLETDDFDVGDAGQMEQDVIKSAVDKFKDQFLDKLDELTTSAKQRVTKALVVLLLATTVAGLVPTEGAMAADIDKEKDKDQQEKKDNYTELDPEEMLGFEVSYMNEEEAKNNIIEFNDFIKDYKPQKAGDLLSFNENIVMHTQDTDNHDNWEIISDDESGTLPEQKEDIIVLNGSTTVISEERDNDNWDAYSGSSNRSEIYGIGEGYSIEAEGEPIEVFGFGENQEDAIRNGLVMAAEQIQVKTMSLSTRHTAQETHKGPDINEMNFNQENKLQHIFLTEETIDSYEVVNTVEEEINSGKTFIKVILKVQPGKVMQQ